MISQVSRPLLVAAALFAAHITPIHPAVAQPGGMRGTPIQQGEECPAGMTEIRPRLCMAPETPAPSIVDYRPQSTLVVPTHMVRAARYPVIDFHGHPQGRLGSRASLDTLVAAMDTINVRLMISADNMSGERLQSAIATINASPQKDRVRVLAGINFRDVGPGWAERAVAQLEADVADHVRVLTGKSCSGLPGEPSARCVAGTLAATANRLCCIQRAAPLSAHADIRAPRRSIPRRRC